MDGAQDPCAFYATQQEKAMLSPDAIAGTHWRLHTQDPTAWTLELNLRPSVECF
jgi:hypothetical protein